MFAASGVWIAALGSFAVNSRRLQRKLGFGSAVAMRESRFQYGAAAACSGFPRFRHGFGSFVVAVRGSNAALLRPVLVVRGSNAELLRLLAVVRVSDTALVRLLVAVCGSNAALLQLCRGFARPIVVATRLSKLDDLGLTGSDRSAVGWCQRRGSWS